MSAFAGKSRTEQASDLRHTRPMFDDRDLIFRIGELSAAISQFWDECPILAVDWGEKGFTIHGSRGSVELDYTTSRILLAAAFVQISTEISATIEGLRFRQKAEG
ncbi:MAG: hypothetical protein ACXACI_15635 [Candidatus Hodarchaeales archaeon]